MKKKLKSVKNTSYNNKRYTQMYLVIWFSFNAKKSAWGDLSRRLKYKE